LIKLVLNGKVIIISKIGNVMIEPDITKKAIETALPFLDKLVGPSFKELGLLLQDNVRIWRFKRQIEMLGKAKKIIEGKNIPIKKISLKVLVPLLDGASLEEDEELLEKWANLLVNYADARNQMRSTVFPYILSQISGIEAHALSFIYLQDSVNFDVVSRKFKIYDAELSNLYRLGLISERPVIKAREQRDYGEYFEQKFEIDDSQPSTYSVTELGIIFIEACETTDIK
jgi:hypothetical protein